jgi:predicted TPR repeat methyltransferase
MTAFDLDVRAARPGNAATAARNFHSAVSLHQQGRLREAEQLYRAVLEVRESDFDCLHNLGLLHAQEGRFDDAVGLLRAGARQDPRSVEVHNNLANVLAILRRHDEAVAGFRIAITLKPDFAEAHNNLGAESVPAAAPKRFVGAVFDRYSDRYDQHVVGALKYQTPDLLRDAIVRQVPSRNLDILDLGCGTGLLGARLRPLARTLTGVDISPNMLKVARQRQIYDNLVCGELVEYLQMQAGELDLAVAADVFVYIGDLSRVFQEVRGALREGGLFGFSVEAGAEQDFVLRASLRYAHSAAYLRKLSQAHGFVLETIESKVLRQEDGSDVIGHLAILRRCGAVPHQSCAPALPPGV